MISLFSFITMHLIVVDPISRPIFKGNPPKQLTYPAANVDKTSNQNSCGKLILLRQKRQISIKIKVGVLGQGILLAQQPHPIKPSRSGKIPKPESRTSEQEISRINL